MKTKAEKKNNLTKYVLETGLNSVKFLPFFLQKARYTHIHRVLPHFKLSLVCLIISPRLSSEIIIRHKLLINPFSSPFRSDNKPKGFHHVICKAVSLPVSEPHHQFQPANLVWVKES